MSLEVSFREEVSALMSVNVRKFYGSIISSRDYAGLPHFSSNPLRKMKFDLTHDKMITISRKIVG